MICDMKYHKADTELCLKTNPNVVAYGATYFRSDTIFSKDLYCAHLDGL